MRDVRMLIAALMVPGLVLMTCLGIIATLRLLLGSQANRWATPATETTPVERGERRRAVVRRGRPAGRSPSNP